MTRSGGYSDATRDRQLQEDRARREADAANRRLRQVYAAAEQQQAAAPGMQQPPHEEVPHSDSDGDEHEFHEAGEDADGAAGAGGDGNLSEPLMSDGRRCFMTHVKFSRQTM